MTIETWLRHALADAGQRGLAELKPLLEMLAQTTVALRQADEELRADEDASDPEGPAWTGHEEGGGHGTR